MLFRRDNIFLSMLVFGAVLYTVEAKLANRKCDLNMCLNGGSCIMLESGKSMCICPLGISGEICEYTACRINPCVNGNCHATGLDSFFCFCTFGYTGEFCENKLENK